MRIGEAISMDKNDIDWENKEAIVVNVKSKEPEKVYFSDRSLYWLKRYLDEPRGRQVPRSSCRREARSGGMARGKCMRRLSAGASCTSLGIKKQITHHIFRKTFVTHLLQRKADIMAVKDLARHRSERTTLQNYAGVDKERSKAIHRGHHE